MPMNAKGLTKLMEECGELVQIAAKKSACLDTDEHWDGKGSLKTRLEDEMGDVLAAVAFVARTLDLDTQRILARKTVKAELFLKWHENPSQS